MNFLATLAAALLLTVSAFAQSSSYKLGDKVADFTLQGVGNTKVSLSDFANSKTVVLVFTNNTCPYAKLYENRLVTLSSTYANRGVQFIFVNPGIGMGEGSETLEDMATKNYRFPYLETGLSKSEALKQAQIRIKSQYDLPFYWAGFILIEA